VSKIVDAQARRASSLGSSRAVRGVGGSNVWFDRRGNGRLVARGIFLEKSGARSTRALSFQHMLQVLWPQLAPDLEAATRVEIAEKPVLSVGNGLTQLFGQSIIALLGADRGAEDCRADKLIQALREA
jgi:hypothetical protein